MQTEHTKCEQAFGMEEELFPPFEEAPMKVAPLPHECDERIKTCDKHGEFSCRRSQSGLWNSCPACAEEREERLRRTEEEAQRRRAADTVARLLRDAAIPLRFSGKTLHNFKAETDPQRRVLQAASDYVENFRKNLATGRSMLWCGPVGTGKTHLACGILDALARAGHRVHYVTVAEIIRWLRETWRKGSDKSEQQAVDWLAELALLVIDEVGMQYGTDAEKIQLFEVMNARYNAMRPTLVLSNLDRDGLRQFCGDRIVERLRENGGAILLFEGESWRGRL
jgi:DNA replication protein DnaC